MAVKRRVPITVALVVLMAVLSGLVAGPAWGQQPERVKVFIGFAHQPGRAEEALVRRAGGIVKYTYHLVPAIAASLPEPAIQGLLRAPGVVRIEPVIDVYAIDAELDNAWGVKRIGAGIVHAGGNKGTGVKVAVVDSGIDYTHPDLGGCFGATDDCKVVGGKDFVNDDDDPMDDAGHGTHVAGTIAAEDDDVDEGVVGVAPEASLYALKVLDANGRGSYADVIAALEWAVDNDIQVTNNSYGSSGDPGETVKAAFADAYTLAGVLNVCAAGNSGAPGKLDSVIYPARYESCIAVAATDQSDERPMWSSTGPDVELAAPGVRIYSTVPEEQGYYASWSGTSMASPHVAGTAALVIAANPTWSIAQVRTQLRDTADDLGAAGPDPQYGFGLVDADEAAGHPTVSITSPTDGSTFDSGATILFEGTASDTEDGDLTASLVWMSSIDGGIGTGGSFSDTLSDGNHTITASVTDSVGKTGSASISITVGTPPTEPTTVSVSSITYATNGGRDGKKHLSVTIALVDDLGNPVSGASVSINLYLGESLYASGAGTTGTEGTVTFSFNNAPSGCYTTTVTNVTAEGLTWDADDPGNVSDEFCK